jgi:beta-apo-4'-carotenal oxygenase
MDIRYPPFTTKKENKYKSMNKIKPDFDREGRSIGWFAWAMGLVGLKSLAAVVGT